MACSRLERLSLSRVDDSLSIIRAMSLPGLTHLDLTGANIDDTAFRGLSDLLPGLRDLRLSGCTTLTSGGLTAALPCLTNLQVLDITNTWINFTDNLISSLSGLPLKALACDCPSDRLSLVVRRCPALYTLKAGVTRWMSGLVRDPVPKHRDITLITPFPNEVGYLASGLPVNIRLLMGTEQLWEELTGWVGLRRSIPV